MTDAEQVDIVGLDDNRAATLTLTAAGKTASAIKFANVTIKGGSISGDFGAYDITFDNVRGETFMLMNGHGGNVVIKDSTFETTQENCFRFQDYTYNKPQTIKITNSSFAAAKECLDVNNKRSIFEITGCSFTGATTNYRGTIKMCNAKRAVIENNTITAALDGDGNAIPTEAFVIYNTTTLGEENTWIIKGNTIDNSVAYLFGRNTAPAETEVNLPLMLGNTVGADVNVTKGVFKNSTEYDLGFAYDDVKANLPAEITSYTQAAWDDATPIWKKGEAAPQADFTGLAADDIVYLKPACTAPTSEEFELEAAPADSAISYTVKAIPYAVLTVTKDENVTTVVVTNQLGETVESGLKVRADAGVTVAVDESKLVFAEGYELDAELSKLSVALTANATISVVAKKSGGWHPDPQKDAGKTAEEAYGIPPASKLAGADAVALGNWAANNTIDFAAFQADPDSFYDAFLLDTTKAGVEEAKKAFKITSITQDSEGNWIVKVTGDKGDEQPYNANALVDIVPYTGIEAGDDAGFFQATLKPIPPTK